MFTEDVQTYPWNNIKPSVPDGDPKGSSALVSSSIFVNHFHSLIYKAGLLQRTTCQISDLVSFLAKK